MANEAARTHELQSSLKAIINVLEDGQKGMASIADHVQDEGLKVFFLAESLKRAGFRGELENELHRMGIADVHESGTAAGVLYRAWADLKGALGGGDRTMLATAEQGEDEAKAAYKDALAKELPMPLRQLLTSQQTQIIASHDFICTQRDTPHAA